MDKGPLWFAVECRDQGSCDEPAAVDPNGVTPTRTQVSYNYLRRWTSWDWSGSYSPDCDREYGRGALIEDLAEANGLHPEAFARELATRQTIDKIGARYGKSPIQMRGAVMDRLWVRLQSDACKTVPFQHTRIDGILDHAAKFVDTLMRQSGAFLAPTFAALSTVDALKDQSDHRIV